MNLPDDVIPLILNNCKLEQIGIFALICTKTNDIVRNFNWEQYYFNRTILYNDIYPKIDINFMKTHGKYLINIKDRNTILRWFIHHEEMIKATDFFDDAWCPEIILSINDSHKFHIYIYFNNIIVSQQNNCIFSERNSLKNVFDELVDIILNNNVNIIDYIDWYQC